MSDNLMHALFYAERDWSVVPLAKADKKALIKWKPYQEHRATDGEITHWFTKWTDANVGIITGKVSGLFVVDVDSVEGLANLEARGEWPDTPSVKTSKVGHYYFYWPDFEVRNAAGLLPGVDVRGEGGLVAAPPSIHHSGIIYEWAVEPGEIYEAPAWLLELLQAKKQPREVALPEPHRSHLNGSASDPDQTRRFVDGCVRSEVGKIERAPDGEKHSQLLKSATYLAGYIPTGAITREEIESTLFEAIAPRAADKQNALDTIRDGIAYGVVKPLDIPAPTPQKRPALRGGRIQSTSDGDDESEGDTQSNAARSGFYDVTNGRTHLVIEKTDKGGNTTVTTPPVWDGWANIAEEITTEENETTYRVEGQTRSGRKINVEIEATKFADSKQMLAVLSNVAGADCVFAASMEKHIAPSIKSFTDRSELLHGRRFNRVGWAGEEFIIPGNEPEFTTIALDRKLPYHLDPDADLDKGLTALGALLRAQSVEATTVATTMMFQAPVARQAGWRDERYALFIAGRTGSFKSSWAMVMMSLWGKDFNNEDRLVKFGQGATNNSIMDHFARASDVPFLVDNYKPSTGGGTRDLVNLIHAAIEGGEKDRLNRNSKQRGSRPIHTWPVFTGEDVPDNDAASMARVLVVPFMWSGGENDALTEAQANCNHLPAVMRAWIDWIQSDEGKPIVANIAARFTARRTMWAQQLRKIRSDMVNINRVASNLATNQLGWEMMEACPFLWGTVAPFTEAHERGLMEVARGMAAHTAESLEANRYLEALRSLLATKRLLLMPRLHDIPDDAKSKYLGWEDEEGVYVVPEIAFTEVSGLIKDNGGFAGVTKNTIHKQLLQIGAIKKPGRDGPVLVAKCGMRAHRVLHLKPELFEMIED